VHGISEIPNIFGFNCDLLTASIAKMARGAAGVYRCKSPEAILEAA